MRKTFILLAALMMGFATLVSAQKPFAGTIKMHQSIIGTDDPNILSQGERDWEVTVWGNYTKTVQSIQEGFGVIAITNGDAGNVLTVLDIMGMGKYYMEIAADKIKEKNKTVKWDYANTGEKMTVAGYECDKINATVTDLETDESQTLVIYVSTAVNPNAEVNFAEYPGLAGFPMRTEVKTDVEGTEVTVVQEATELKANKKLKVVDFMLPSDAQDIKTNPELMKMLGLGGDEEEE